ncbi:RagB/SusD family nutrient uptake outer membrane protein [Pontibacter diazotrophicus]|uniref:RagB/SusD family nutrient uptake outer membrane protein n=1 Tax=Pontibacter diazotrophicus TaxID=1400979 RepID=A0A3D8L759_9BACT|nr:RagB/SusD family nutrient uptake outer membrane protein [Pontibacter diazotrophicus]RDV13245.1 RagB/SusD family nutrient uptake outer membrane protein [Pontibacter diazotrophicus]
MKTKIFAILFCALTFAGCEDDFLDTPPIDKLTDETYWTTEENVRTFSYGFYPAYFTGYGSGYTWGSYFSGQSLNDDFAPSNPAQFTKNVPASGGGWTFAWVRKANVFIDRVQDVPMSDEAKNHWTGIGRFFRAMEYADLVNQFGDVPWLETELTEADTEQLYKPRDSRTFVMDKVLADFRHAAENVRVADGANGLTVNRNVVLAYMSRVFLFEGTWQKYHANNPAKAAEYLEAAKWAAEQVISSGKYTLGNYRAVFNSLNLAGNPEVILYRQYEPGILTHALNSYNNKEPQTGVSKDAVEAYLAEDGLPISVSALYQGDKGIENVMANRDPRIAETFVTTELRLNGIANNHSTSGYATHKFLNEAIKDIPEGSSNLNPTDAPVIRYGEVLINYAEAAAELATVGGPALTQQDLDLSVNVLRARPGIGMPALEVNGDQVAVNGISYDDTQRDPSVSPVIWEIRRERRVELMMEGFRLDDLRRWKKLEYTDTQANTDINRGAWVSKAEYPGLNTSVVLSEGEEGYIIPSTKAESQRIFADPKVYLDPLPLDQVKLYKDAGASLTQNPGWE